MTPGTSRIKGVSVEVRSLPATGPRGRCCTAAFCLSLASVLLSACGSGPGRKSACDGLVYKEYGLSRTEYLPCAGEMIATMDQMRPHLDALLAGDESARSKARGQLRDLGDLIRKAGGRNLLERWQDSFLNDLNIEIWNAYNHYQAGLMVPLIAKSQSGSAQAREAVEDEFRNGNEAYGRAKSLYEGMR